MTIQHFLTFSSSFHKLHLIVIITSLKFIVVCVSGTKYIYTKEVAEI